jgi:TetR/AcrR family transcriptional regulator, repressor of fatR-cypB operon
VEFVRSERPRFRAGPGAAAFLVRPADPPSKQAILCAALRLFVDKGFESTSIRQIAREAGYTNPALFKFFGSKEELGVYLFEQTYQELMLAFEPHLDEVRPVEQVLAAWADAYLGLLANRRHAFLYVHDHLAYFWPRVSVRFGGRSLFTLMREWIERGRVAGVLSSAVPVDVQIAAVSGFFRQFAKMVELGEVREQDLDGLHEALTRMLLNVLTHPSTRHKKR